MTIECVCVCFMFNFIFLQIFILFSSKWTLETSPHHLMIQIDNNGSCFAAEIQQNFVNCIGSIKMQGQNFACQWIWQHIHIHINKVINGKVVLPVRWFFYDFFPLLCASISIVGMWEENQRFHLVCNLTTTIYVFWLIQFHREW